jgi:hypothetical protein
MNHLSIAPCGVICDLCYAYQRDKSKCVGCNNDGNKPYHCTVCSIKCCPEKQGNEQLSCIDCFKFPCRRIKNLDKRYIIKYAESLIQNLRSIEEFGLTKFIENEREKWKCCTCGELLCVHREICLNCGARNYYFPSMVD